MACGSCVITGCIKPQTWAAPPQLQLTQWLHWLSCSSWRWLRHTPWRKSSQRNRGCWSTSLTYALEENTLACPEGFSLSCKPICCTVGQSGGTCADFGANFTMSTRHYCEPRSYDTKSQECCECVSSAPAITSLPQSTGIKWVTSQDCELATYGRYPPTSCGLANLSCPQGFALSSPMMGCSACPDRYATRVKLNSSGYCVEHGFGFESDTYPPSWVCQTCVQEPMGTTTSTTTAIRYGALDPTCTDGGFRDRLSVWKVRVHAVATTPTTTMEATTMLFRPTASMSARASVFWSCRSAKALSTALVGVRFGHGLKESLWPRTFKILHACAMVGPRSTCNPWMEAVIVPAAAPRPRTIQSGTTGCRSPCTWRIAKPAVQHIGQNVMLLSSAWAVVRFGKSK